MLQTLDQQEMFIFAEPNILINLGEVLLMPDGFFLMACDHVLGQLDGVTGIGRGLELAFE